MKTKRTFELTVEHSEFFILRRPRGAAPAWCETCARRVPLVTPEEAARRAGSSVRAIYRRVEAGELHFLEMNEGALLVCLESLT